MGFVTQGLAEATDIFLWKTFLKFRECVENLGVIQNMQVDRPYIVVIFPSVKSTIDNICWLNVHFRSQHLRARSWLLWLIINEALVLFNISYILWCHSRPKWCCHIWDDRFQEKAALPRNEAFCATLQGCHGNWALLHGNFPFPGDV